MIVAVHVLLDHHVVESVHVHWLRPSTTTWKGKQIVRGRHLRQSDVQSKTFLIISQVWASFLCQFFALSGQLNYVLSHQEL